MNTGTNRSSVVTALLMILLLVGCGQELMPTPNCIVQSKDDPFANVPEVLRSNRAEIIYATDRVPIQDKKAGLRYGYERSKSLAFGSCAVEIGHNLSWDDLVCESRKQKRSKSLPLTVPEIHEVGRFPAVPDMASFNNGQYVERPEVVAERTARARQLTALLSERLSQTPRKDAYIYIHGFANTFEDAAFVAAGFWHFMGRTGVPIIYTWPAGSPDGALGGYTHDSESGQFTGYHLRNFLRMVASCPDVEKIHLIAHSRGTDVLMTAIRELNLEYQAAGKVTRSELKLGNLILAAADMDFEVTSQRIVGEQLPLIPEQMTLYVSKKDRAIAAADFLFGSKSRLGQLRWKDMSPEQQKALGAVPQMNVIDVIAHTGFLGHSYFHENPATSSDVILVLRDNRAPGAENGRPLLKEQEGFWEIEDGYPQFTRQ